MSEEIKDLKDDVVAEEVAAPVEEVVETPVVEEAPVVEEPVVKEEKPKAKKEEKAKVEKDETVALFSKGNIHWAEVGKLSTGYNLVSKADSEKWLAKFKNVRLATPEEVAAKAKN